MKTRTSRLASELLVLPTVTWLGLGAVLWASSGCLIPQDDTYFPGIPQAKNRPPRIVETQVQPTERIIEGFGGSVCVLDFAVAVEDPDVDDRIVVSWYVDYNAANHTPPWFVVGLRPNGQPLREERGNVRFQATSLPLSTPGVHLVEAVVSDAQLINREPEPRQVIRTEDGGYIVNPGYVTTYSWYVRTVQGGDCP